jgi:acetyl-CoA carboxylase biotin carboxyl carrier protein
VEEGDEVSAGDTIGLIEVMKNFNEITVEEDGKISKFLVEDEEAVDAGQDLVELE